MPTCLQGKRPPMPEDPAVCPRPLASLLDAMWAGEPKMRPGAGEVIKQLSLVQALHAPAPVQPEGTA